MSDNIDIVATLRVDDQATPELAGIQSAFSRLNDFAADIGASFSKLGGAEIGASLQGLGSSLSDLGRVPKDERPSPMRRSVFVHQDRLAAGQLLKDFARVADRRAARDDLRARSMPLAEAQQAPQDVSHVRAEHAAVDVHLVQYDQPKGPEELPPMLVAGQDAQVEHIGVR